MVGLMSEPSCDTAMQTERVHQQQQQQRSEPMKKLPNKKAHTSPKEKQVPTAEHGFLVQVRNRLPQWSMDSLYRFERASHSGAWIPHANEKEVPTVEHRFLVQVRSLPQWSMDSSYR